ncbi:MAG: di-heme oxidoredictase family protein, partial [Bacteroidota bacterium]
MKGFWLCLLAVFVLGCKSEKDQYLAVYEEGEEFLTSHLGMDARRSNTFGTAVPGLSFKQRAKFMVGNSLFKQAWVSSPASTTARDGLGPTFNARACVSCHANDGRGKPLLEDEKAFGFLMRISQDGKNEKGGPLGLPNYGTQIHDHSNRGIPFEAKLTVTYDTIHGRYADGKPYSLLQPMYGFKEENFGELSNVLTSPRVAPQTIGMGFINALPDNEILKFADEFDKNGDGISGRPNLVWNYETDEEDLGRFGWKANEPTLKTQIASAFHGDMGLTNTIFIDQNCPESQEDCNQAPNGGQPEVTEKQLERVLFYQASIGVPNRRNVKKENVLKGKVLFEKLNCIGCHSINQVTKESSINPILTFSKIG